MGDGGYQHTLPNGLTIRVRVGHLDRMPRCQHGRVICRSCEEADEGFGGIASQSVASPENQVPNHFHNLE